MCWLPIATKEFYMQFVPRKIGGNRDFLWITMLLCLLILFALLSLGTREGFSDKLVELLLGRVPGKGGIPVWVRSNPFSIGGKNLIDQQVIDKIHDADNFQFYPYREVDYTMLDLPANNIWKQARLSDEAPSFQGIAVYQDDPLWAYGTEKIQVTDKLHIVMNRSFVQANLDYDTYKTSLKELLPSSLWHELPDEKQFYGSQKSFMWLNVGPKHDLLRVSINWLERIPIPGKIAYLFPLDIFHLLQVSHFYPSIIFYPESSGMKKSFRVKHVAIDKVINSIQIKQLEQNLDAQSEDSYGRYIFELENPLPRYIVNAYIQSMGILKNQYEIAQEIYADNAFQDTYWQLKVPCDKMPEFNLSHGDATKCAANEDYLVTHNIDAFIRGFVYIKDRKGLTLAVQKLKNLPDRPLLIPWIYSDALRRFGALIYLIDMISKPYIILFCFFLASLMFVQTATLISHRRHNYGIFLSKGIRQADIYLMIIYQITIALTIGTLLAIVLYNGMRHWINEKLIIAAKSFRDVLTLDHTDLLPLNEADIILCFGIEIAISWIILMIILYFMPLRKKTMPGDLLH
jgi:hypothetical protein